MRQREICSVSFIVFTREAHQFGGSITESRIFESGPRIESRCSKAVMGKISW